LRSVRLSYLPKVVEQGAAAALGAEQPVQVPVVLRGLALLLHQGRRPAREWRLHPLPAERPEPAPRRHLGELRLPVIPSLAVRDLRLSVRLGSRPARHLITCPQRERPRAFLVPQRRRAPPAVRQPCRQPPLQGERSRHPPLRAAGAAQEAEPTSPWGAWT